VAAVAGSRKRMEEEAVAAAANLPGCHLSLKVLVRDERQ
jgi:hypothetical protein